MIDELLDWTDVTEPPGAPPSDNAPPWKLLVVDDDPEVHGVTRFVLRNLRVLGRPLRLLHARSAREARECLREHPDIAVALVDVVMETDQAGLDLVEYIRDELGLTECRIILRTGQPGYAPELTVIHQYDINDYRTKAELTHTRLITTVSAALRAYQQLRALAENRRGLELIVRAAADLMEEHAIADLAEGVLTQLAALFKLPLDGVVCAQKGSPFGDDADRCYVVGAAGRHAPYIAQPLETLPDRRIVAAILAGMTRGQHVFGPDYTVLYLKIAPQQAAAIFLDSDRALAALDHPLLEVFVANIAACFRNVNLVESLLRAQREIERHRSFLRTVIDADPHCIYVKDRQGRIVLANRCLARSFGLAPEQMVGRTSADLIADPDWVQALFDDDTAVLTQTRDQVERETKFIDPAGQTRWAYIVKAPIRNAAGEVEQLIGVGIDITGRKLLEEQLETSLREKEVLLREIHHRVKNNLQVISSLLDLQADQIEDPAARDQFRESRNRMKSMSLIHERLYQAPNLARIDFAEYAQGLTTYLIQSHAMPGRNITARVAVEPRVPALSIEIAIPCGLIINELITNALKHAFVGRQAGEISVTLEAADRQLALRVRDNGTGFPAAVDFRDTPSLGLTITTTLVKQLQGNIELRTQAGTEFVITFPDPSMARRTG